jgi:DNA-binding MarR family transcriptional regulator
MSATVIESVDEMRRFEPVSDAMVLAAIDRAERHRGGTGEGARMSNLAEHLGLVHGARTTLGLRPQLDALIDAGALERARRQGLVLLVLTEKGRRGAARARQTVALPESPQHRAWKQTRRKAVERIDGLREDARRAVQDAGRLLDTEEADSEALFLLAVRLGEALQYLGSATYCAREWAEPDDARADTDDDRPPWYRPSRRSTRGWGRSTGPGTEGEA